MTQDDAERFIRTRKWQFAKTYAHTDPHEYTVRAWRPGPSDQGEFEGFAAYVREHGEPRDWKYGKRYTYLELLGHKYWTMGNPLPETTVINREPLPVQPTDVGSQPHPLPDPTFEED